MKKDNIAVGATAQPQGILWEVRGRKMSVFFPPDLK